MTIGRCSAAALLLAGTAGLVPTGTLANGLPLAGQAAESFLLAAEVVESEMLAEGITRSRRLVLRHGDLTARAIFKTVNEYKPLMRFTDGSFEMGFHDSYKNEVAAWELDKLIGLGLVPPVVERKIGAERGSLQLWVEDAMTEAERLRSGDPQADPRRWNEQIYKVRLFHNLTFNTDFNNITNILCDAQSNLYLIDHSRAFRNKKSLLAPGDLTRFSRALLESIAALDEQVLEERLGRWLTRTQIRALLARRDLIVARATRLAAERGEAEVFYP